MRVTIKRGDEPAQIYIVPEELANKVIPIIQANGIPLEGSAPSVPIKRPKLAPSTMCVVTANAKLRPGTDRYKLYQYLTKRFTGGKQFKYQEVLRACGLLNISTSAAGSLRRLGYVTPVKEK